MTLQPTVSDKICGTNTNFINFFSHTPKTKHCMQAYQWKHKLNKTTASQEKQKIKVRRLSVLDVCEFVVENNLHTDIELFAKLTNFLVSRSNKSLQDLLSNAWKMESSTAVLARKATTRMEVVRKCAAEDCVEGVNGEWLVCAEYVLTQSKVHPVIYALAIRDLLVKGLGKRQKYNDFGARRWYQDISF